MAGVELFHVYQLIFCVVLLENRVTVFYAILKLFTYTQINPLYFLNERNNLKITNKVLEFNSQNQLFSYAVLIVVYCACALAFGVLYAVEQLKGLSLSHLKRFVYNVFIIIVATPTIDEPNNIIINPFTSPITTPILTTTIRT